MRAGRDWRCGSDCKARASTTLLMVVEQVTRDLDIQRYHA